MEEKDGYIKLKGGGYIPLYVKSGVYIAAAGCRDRGLVRISAAEGFTRQAVRL